MHTKSPLFSVGIDLGTTHTAVAYCRIDQPDKIELLNINQLIAPGQVAAKTLLPSVRYHPAEHEFTETERVFVQPDSRAILGEAARQLGAKTKGRLVTSAKSWLSHTSVDHNAAFLPWGSHDEVEKVSPVEASASYLRHLRTAWTQQFPDAPLENQDIVITVPASFDEGARSLTMVAAHSAGLPNVRLLEEPQAVCYDWLRRHTGNITAALTGIRLLLVCDIGGGTTDLTLIKVEPAEPEPKLTRIAVGDHIMLGGDNMDLALAHLVENRLQKSETRLSAADLSQLIEQCRAAKERLLAEHPPEQIQVTLLGGGTQLVGGARSAYLTQEDIKTIALDGFFPLTGLQELPDKKRSGVVEFGLPYAAEPAISKHIAAFLNLHKEASLQALQDNSTVPDALLLNGGLFRSNTIVQRVLALLTHWKKAPIALLENQYPEFAVAYGAVSYAVARRSRQLKIGGGTARSYFLRVETTSSQENNNASPSMGLCVLPKGTAEGEEIVLHNRRFALRTRVPVRFDLASYVGDNTAKPGELVEITNEFQSLPPLVVAFDETSTQESNNEAIIVQLGVTYTELGTIKIQCIEVNEQAKSISQQTEMQPDKQRWNVEFQIRKQGDLIKSANYELPNYFDAAAEQIQAIFGPKSKQIDPNAVKNLRATIEKCLGQERVAWDSHLLRHLFAVLLDGQKYRRRSSHHERVWFSLIGFCLRPGFGMQLDDWRVEQLWKLYPQGLQFTSEIQNWSEWWILWRRIAGGLGSDAQEQIYADIANYINPAANRQASVAKQGKLRSYDDMVRLAAVLERLPVNSKVQLGEWLLKRLEKTSEPQQTWWAMGRVGARVPFYGSAHTVVPSDSAARWLNLIMAQAWKNNQHIAFAATLIARVSGDRARDIDEKLRFAVSQQLKASKSSQIWITMVEKLVELEEKEASQVFGEALPPGLMLI